ncbi:gastrula zinc finger protein XlCGF57.1-like [Folsomia candida]|uniref:gastrula zinc finger protein XlCGF57.1-like n=1 Tax=Folsomia candida TaxID=158441 RepID=UPI001604EC85|nr:gastrula zinc finger protein XlCGF57.1-like [Folsomia candida]XP_035711191.1 gastrula zinc finger protein XlCGF57.1-like [Folsomia candida]
MKSRVPPGKSWDCPSCPKSFPCKSRLAKHVVTHDPNAQVKCGICGKALKNSLTLICHMSFVHSKRKHSCQTCHRKFVLPSDLRNHAAVHSTSRIRHPCTFPGCGKSFLAKYNVLTHFKREHDPNAARFPCQLCGREFKRKEHMEHHISTHTTEKLHKCAHCEKSFVQSGARKIHEKTHRDPTSREVFTCHLCPQTFLYTRSLSGHVKSVHGKDRNYQCKFCNRKFSQKSCMRTHIDAQHTSSEDPRYSCGSCEYKTDYKGNFDQHKRKHEIDRKNQSCYFCGKTFTTFYGLARHCRQFHTREKL